MVLRQSFVPAMSSRASQLGLNAEADGFRSLGGVDCGEGCRRVEFIRGSPRSTLFKPSGQCGNWGESLGVDEIPISGQSVLALRNGSVDVRIDELPESGMDPVDAMLSCGGFRSGLLKNGRSGVMGGFPSVHSALSAMRQMDLNAHCNVEKAARGQRD